MAVAGTPLPPVVDKGLVGLGHAVRIVPLLDRRSLLAVGVHDLRRQTLGHGATGAAPGCSQEPAHGQRHLAGGTLFLPFFITLLIIVCTQTLPYLASGGVAWRMTLPRLGTGGSEAYRGPSALRVPYLLRCCCRPWARPA